MWRGSSSSMPPSAEKAAVRRLRASRSALIGIVRELVDSARVARPHAARRVCAIGGYGRRSQFLHSDIDLLVIFGGADWTARRAVRQGAAAPAVGSAVSGRPSCARASRDFDRLETDNPEFLLALMDLRPLAGDRELLRSLLDAVDARRRARNGIRRFSRRSSR